MFVWKRTLDYIRLARWLQRQMHHCAANELKELQALLFAIAAVFCPALAATPATSNAPEAISQGELDWFADHIQLRYRLLDNTPTASCLSDQAGGACFTAEIELTAAATFTANNWSIFFSHVSPIQRVDGDRFRIHHVNGDLHELRPGPGFPGFLTGQPLTVRFQAAFWLISKADLMPNYYIVVPGLQPRLLRSTQSTIDPETGLSQFPFISPLKDPEKHLKRTAADRSIQATTSALFNDYQAWNEAAPTNQLADLLPTPSRIEPRRGTLSLVGGLRIQNSDFASTGLVVALQRLTGFGIESTSDGLSVSLHKVPATTVAAEAYVLDIAADRITIFASDDSGAFYALQSLTALVVPGSKTVPLSRIEDRPRYPFRGLHLDVARNFHSKALLLKLLDQMAAYKLNRLHLHLADDEGWRLQIPGLPELTDIGGYRCHDPEEKRCLLPQLGSGPSRESPVNGYFTTADYIELVRAANSRHIQIIPSLDMPGHARAAVRSMRARHDQLLAAGKLTDADRYLLDETSDQSHYESIQFYRDNTINVCLPSAYTFVEKIVTEVQKLHEQAGQPLTRFHIGADETPGAWQASPACQKLIAANENGVNSTKQLGAHFLLKVGALLRRRGIELAAWSDGLEHLSPVQLPGVVQGNAWGLLPWQGHRAANRLANQGWQVVVSSPDVTYFDFPYVADPEEGGYYWGTRSSDTRKVFEFMPDNLPAHAEFWPDRQGLPYESDDRVQRDENGQVTAEPLRPGEHFHGLQAQLWSETIRSDSQVEYMLFPRLIALAERAWHQADWELPYDHEGTLYNIDSHHFDASRRAMRARDWQRFAGLLATRELAKLEQQHIAYRLPTVGAVIRDGMLNALLPFSVHTDSGIAGLGIEYRCDGGSWLRYLGPVAVTGAVEVRAVSVDGKRKGRALPVIAP